LSLHENKAIVRGEGNMSSNISVIATGDSFITQRLPRAETDLVGIRLLFQKADVRFTNLEVTIHDFDAYPAASSGGTWAAARPAVLSDLEWLGFNMLAWANNHTLDWSHNGLLITLEHLEKGGWVHAGVGRNLAEANQPRYLDTPCGRVALIAASSTIQDWHRAGEQRPDVPGRPGVNPLRFQAIHRVSQEDFDRLKQIIGRTEINASRLLNEKEGFAKSEEGAFLVGTHRFEVGEPGTVTRMNNDDAERIARSIREAARQADIVLVSHHAHEMKGMSKDQPADFLKEFARFCIDNGAHAFIGHGPHILRGIEIYKDRPIFYSLGNFIFQNDTVEKQPTEFYDIYGLGPQNTPSDGFDARSLNGTRGLAANPKVFESVIAFFDFAEGELKSVKLYPISLGFHLPRSRRGRPALASRTHAEKILNHLQELSEPFGTSIRVENGMGVIDRR
jgi:poly-gamma-glutamate capsule biosynthesis protein CapA/YwtB (metallophosphatase superfamily)